MSFGRSRIAEFHGTSSLLEATEAVLSNSDLDAAIIRKGIHPRDISYRDVHADIEEALPWDKVDAVVEVWSDENLPPDLALIGRHNPNAETDVSAQPRVMNRDTALHYDLDRQPYICGPISYSVRFDRNGHLGRTFFVRRPPVIPPLVEPKTTMSLIEKNFLYQRQYFTKQTVGRLLMSTVTQRQGDIVVFPNWPHPALHGVTAQEEPYHQGRTAAAIHTYWMRSI